MSTADPHPAPSNRPGTRQPKAFAEAGAAVRVTAIDVNGKRTSNGHAPIRVLLADDHPIVRKGVLGGPDPRAAGYEVGR